MENREELIHLPNVDGERARAYSSEEFGELLLVSQWSLSHRIMVCQALQDPANHWIMAPLSRHEYAKQSLALIDPTATPLEDVSSSFPDFYDWRGETEGLEQLRSKLKDELPKQVEKSVYKKWEKLTLQLQAKLKSVRESDKKQAWYSAFERKKLIPWGLYNSVEQGNMYGVSQWILQVGKEKWGSITPGEYRGATPFHWAVLFAPKGLFMGNFMEDDGIDDKCGDIRDEFGFAPVHMAIFSSSSPKFFPKHSEVQDWAGYQHKIRGVLSSFNMMWKNHCVEMSGKPDFLFFNRQWDNSNRACFLATRLSSREARIFPIQLAVWVAHPLVTEKLMDLVEEGDLLVKTSGGDTILHLAACRMNYDTPGLRGTVMAILTRRILHRSPAMLNSFNQKGMTPAHIAVFQGDYELVKALLRLHYVQMNIKNDESDFDITPAEIATQMIVTFGGKSLVNKRLLEVRAQMEYDGRLGSVRQRYGLSMGQYEYNSQLGEPLINLGDLYERIVDLIEINPEIQRYRQLLQISQWSVRHRILALQMIDENGPLLGTTKPTFTQQCLELAGMNLPSTDGSEDMALVDKLRRKVVIELKNQNDDSSRILRDIFYAIEEGDLILFKGMVSSFSDEILQSLNDGFRSSSTQNPPSIEPLKEYRGATPLHWALLYGEMEMVSILGEAISAPTGMSPIESNGHKTWSAFVKARDEFGFMPLLLAMFSFLWQLGKVHIAQCKDLLLQYFEVATLDDLDKNWETCSQLIEDLCQVGLPHGASSSFKSDFMVWKLSDSLDMYADSYLSNSIIYPVILSVYCCGHPQVLEKFLETFGNSEALLLKRNANEDTILHDARIWNALSEKCSKDIWEKIETLLLTYLNIPSNSQVVNLPNNDGETPLQKAVNTISPKWLKVLLQCEHIKVNTTTSSDTVTILHEASAWETCLEREELETLLLKCLNQPFNSQVMNFRSSNGQTLLQTAMLTLKPKWVKVLLQCEHFTFEMLTSAAGDTILHDATTWEGLIKHKDGWKEIETILLKRLDNPSNPKSVNSRNNNRETPLHKAVRMKSSKWVKFLSQCEHIKFNLRDWNAKSPREVAAELLKNSTYKESTRRAQYLPKWIHQGFSEGTPSSDEVNSMKEIIDYIDSFDPESWPQERERLQRDRQVYVDAANAILVGAALIASASFGAWLQPPLGLVQYYSPEFLVTSPVAAPGTYESFVGIEQHWIIQLFWIFNSLAFFFSLATVIAGADAALPWQESELKDAVDSVRSSVKIASGLLGIAILFVIGTFATLGFAILPPIKKYRINMWCTLVVGLIICGVVLFRLLRKLVLKRNPKGKTKTKNSEDTAHNGQSTTEDPQL